MCICKFLSDMCSFPLQQSFMKQFLASVNESDYITMRLGFVTVYILDF